MTAAVNDRLDELRRELPDVMVDRIEGATSALARAGAGSQPPAEVTELLGLINAGQELTHSLIAAELELGRLARLQSQGDRSPELQSRITTLRTLRSQLAEGLTGLLSVLNTES